MEDTIVSSIGSCGNGLANLDSTAKLNSTGSCLSSCSLQEVHKWTGLSRLSCCHTLNGKIRLPSVHTRKAWSAISSFKVKNAAASRTSLLAIWTHWHEVGQHMGRKVTSTTAASFGWAEDHSYHLLS